jgi:hypothetical protein
LFKENDMLRDTSLALALAKAVQKTDPKGLGIEHKIRHTLAETSVGVKKEPDVFINSSRYKGAYTPPVDKPEVEEDK